ncbi:choice-of-anchor E domain-containing protein [Nocardioides sp. WS12]|uniref:choice-of-anchor E domain-containing protein n=1 Tax=Nocardioides sp. WS12 TaxID=2486272 RepID=UPI0015FD17A7|nr:choice-of-anchor E domain-containing protein [Nocardioides sp. WS12]
MTKRAVRIAAAGAVASVTVFTMGVAPASAVTGDTQTVTFDLGDLDASGTGQIEQFDPDLGELTSVKIEAEVTMDFAVCITNLSEEASSVNSGNVSGAAPLTFAGDVVAQTSGAMEVPALELAANGGTDGCSAWEEAGGDPNTAPAGANSQLTAGSDSDTFSTTITDEAALAPYVGTGTVGFDYTASSASNLSQPSEWTLVFLASGAGEVNVTYTYDEGDVGGIDEGDGDLPNTGGPDGWLVPVGAALVLAGAALVMVRRPHSA